MFTEGASSHCLRCAMLYRDYYYFVPIIVIESLYKSEGVCCTLLWYWCCCCCVALSAGTMDRIMSSTELVSFLREHIQAQTDFTGHNMFHFRAVDDSVWRLRLQSVSKTGRMDLKLYGPGHLILHSVDRIKEHFTWLEMRYEETRRSGESTSNEKASHDRDSTSSKERENRCSYETIEEESNDTTLAMYRIQIAVRMYLQRKHYNVTQALQKQQDIMLHHIQSEQTKLEEMKASIDEQLRARTATLESWQKHIHKYNVSRHRTVTAAKKLTYHVVRKEREVVSYDLTLTMEEKMQGTVPVNLTRDHIHARVDTLLQETVTANNRAIVPLAKSIKINQKARFPLLTEALSLYLSPRCIDLPQVGTLMLSRTEKLSSEASGIVRSRFNRNILNDIHDSLEANHPYMASFDIRVRSVDSSSFEVVGVLVLRKYTIRCFGVCSQALCIDVIGIHRNHEGKGIGSVVLDLLYDVVRQGNTHEDRMPCYIFAQCVRDKFWDLRASNTHEARAMVFQVYMLDPMREHIYKDCTPRAIQVFNELKGQSPLRVSE